MFVYVKFEDSNTIDLFGPSTPGECESWMKIMKLMPRNARPENPLQPVLTGRRITGRNLLTE